MKSHKPFYQAKDLEIEANVCGYNLGNIWVFFISAREDLEPENFGGSRFTNFLSNMLN